MTRYRVVRDGYCGFEVQAKRWWLPFWIQCSGDHGGFTNTHSSLERAKDFISRKEGGGVVYEHPKPTKFRSTTPSKGQP